MAELITSTTNRRVKAVRELHQRKVRKQRRETIIEGPTVFGDFIDAGVIPSVILCTPDDSLTMERCATIRVEPVLVTKDVLASASDTRTPQSPIAVVPVPAPEQLRQRNTLVLVDIADPGNVGTMIRSAAALGWDVAVSGTTAEVWAPKTIRSSAGTLIHTRLIQLSDPAAEAVTAGLTTIVSIVAGGEAPHQQATPVALLIGSEAHGLPKQLLDQCENQVTIEMQGGTESLNAAIAASILMYAMDMVDGS